jgi:acyl-CoA hydrolase
VHTSDPAPVPADVILSYVNPGTNVIVATANGEPVTVLDALEAGADGLEGVRVHQVFALHDRPHHAGAFGDRLRHVSYFLSASLREHWARDTIDLVPNDLSQVAGHLRRLPDPKILVASASPPDKHGFFSLGTGANYTATLMGEIPIFIEANAQMPRTSGRHQLHISQVLGWCEADYPLIATPPPTISETDRAIAGFVAERIPNGATLQIGVGSVPDAVAELLVDHRDLGVHTELFGDGLRMLIEAGAATGARKTQQRFQAICGDALGSPELYEFLDDNHHVQFWPIAETNDSNVIERLDDFVAINATLQVDLLGQCGSESLGTHYVSGTGGQADFMRGAMLSKGGQSFIVTHATAVDGTVSRIVPTLTPGAVVTTHKNIVDKVATEHGVAELRGRTIADRARALIAIADPAFRDDLTRQAQDLGYVP